MHPCRCRMQCNGEFFQPCIDTFCCKKRERTRHRQHQQGPAAIFSLLRVVSYLAPFQQRPYTHPGDTTAAPAAVANTKEARVGVVREGAECRQGAAKPRREAFVHCKSGRRPVMVLFLPVGACPCLFHPDQPAEEPGSCSSITATD